MQHLLAPRPHRRAVRRRRVRRAAAHKPTLIEKGRGRLPVVLVWLAEQLGVGAAATCEEPPAAVSLGVLLADGVGCDGDAADGGAGSCTPLDHPRRLVIHAAWSSMPLGHPCRLVIHGPLSHASANTFAARQRLCRTPVHPIAARAALAVCHARGLMLAVVCLRIRPEPHGPLASVLLHCAVCVLQKHLHPVGSSEGAQRRPRTRRTRCGGHGKGREGRGSGGSVPANPLKVQGEAREERGGISEIEKEKATSDGVSGPHVHGNRVVRS